MESVPTKKGSKKSLLMCFKLVEGVDDSFKSVKRRKRNATPDPVLTYLSAADEDGIVFFSSKEDGREERRSRRRKKGRDTWQALRKVLNETTLMKKILRRWRTKKESLSRSNTNNMEAEASGKHKTTRRTNSNASSTLGGSSAIFTSSSYSLSSTSSSRTDHLSGSSSHEINPPPLNGIGGGVSKQSSVEDRRKGNCGPNTTLCMLLIISVLVLILWGKFFAILCTSIWFYLVPLGRRRPCSEGVSFGESECDSVQYKKNIIMEGLLERSHSRVSLASMSKSLWKKAFEEGKRERLEPHEYYCTY